ncbi:hypothetical protein BZA77DRAFT_313853 [Pyronema omphalodes]|nr:hypothetical protein BZA77DRAFT_313853 [Pyronema omphalodes]
MHHSLLRNISYFHFTPAGLKEAGTPPLRPLPKESKAKKDPTLLRTHGSLLDLSENKNKRNGIESQVYNSLISTSAVLSIPRKMLDPAYVDIFFAPFYICTLVLVLIPRNSTCYRSQPSSMRCLSILRRDRNMPSHSSGRGGGQGGGCTKKMYPANVSARGCYRWPDPQITAVT